MRVPRGHPDQHTTTAAAAVLALAAEPQSSRGRERRNTDPTRHEISGLPRGSHKDLEPLAGGTPGGSTVSPSGHGAESAAGRGVGGGGGAGAGAGNGVGAGKRKAASGVDWMTTLTDMCRMRPAYEEGGGGGGL